MLGCSDNVEGGWVSSVLGAEVAVVRGRRSVSNLCPQLTVLTRSVTSQSSLVSVVSVDNSWPWDRCRPWPPSPSPCWSAATSLKVPEKIFRYCEKIFRYLGSCFGASVFIYAPSLAIAITWYINNVIPICDTNYRSRGLWCSSPRVLQSWLWLQRHYRHRAATPAKTVEGNFYNQSIFCRISSQQTTIDGGVLLTVLSLQKWIFQWMVQKKWS